MTRPTERAGVRALATSIGGALALCVSAPAAASVPTPPAPQTPGTRVERLSNETTLTSWAHPAASLPVRRSPRSGSPSIARLRQRTEHGSPEVYLLLGRRTGPDGNAWIRVRLPMWPNGATGWVPAGGLGRIHTVTTQLVIDRRRLRATLLRGARRIWSSRVAIGTPRTPTPAGRFWIRERIRVARSSGPYGPWAFGTSAYSLLRAWPGGGVVGIHGTNQPRLIPGRPSHGCVRLPNPAIRRLAKLMPIGTPIHIR